MSDTTNPITHVFDQTNGVIDGLEDESDGGGAGSAADRDPDAVAPREDAAAPDGSSGAVAVAATGDDAPATTPAAEADFSETSASAEPYDGAPTEPIAADPASDDSIGHVFDQTNGVADGLEGDSDGTAAGDEASEADRDGQNEPNPVGQQDAFHDDHYGAQDGRDPNP